MNSFYFGAVLVMMRSCSPVSVLTTSPASVHRDKIEESTEHTVTDIRDLIPGKIAEAVANNGTEDVDPLQPIFW